ncbi:MAG: 4a-hydroxytetrahydrobiopterin dehydratase [Candidatus Ratteibacteria bacterium]
MRSEEDLAKKKCVPCEVGGFPLSEESLPKFLAQIPGWSLEKGKLTRTFRFKSFSQAMEFVNVVAAIAEEEGHHPSFFILYNKVILSLYTYAVRGLSENDFIMAVKIGMAVKEGKEEKKS